MNSIDNYDQYLSLNRQNPSTENTNKEDDIRLTEEVVEWLDQLGEPDEHDAIRDQQLSDTESISPIIASRLKILRDRRQAMPRYNNEYFGNLDKAAKNNVLSQIVGK